PTHGGGQGKAWNWADAGVLIGQGYDVILAGGLDPRSVGAAIEGVGDVLPWGVDVATGVESEPRRKDAAKMRAFVEAVRRAEGKEWGRWRASRGASAATAGATSPRPWWRRSTS